MNNLYSYLNYSEYSYNTEVLYKLTISHNLKYQIISTATDLVSFINSLSFFRRPDHSLFITTRGTY